MSEEAFFGCLQWLMFGLMAFIFTVIFGFLALCAGEWVWDKIKGRIWG